MTTVDAEGFWSVGVGVAGRQGVSAAGETKAGTATLGQSESPGNELDLCAVELPVEVGTEETGRSKGPSK